MKKQWSVSSFVIGILLCGMAAVGFLPFLHMIAVAFSGGSAASANLVRFFPVDFSLDAFREAVADSALSRSAIISLERVILGTAITMTLTILTAYPISFEKNEFPGRGVYVVFLMITMLFSGGLIPSYILVSRMGLVNHIWALVVPGAVPIFNVIVLLNFFRGIPKEIHEAAMIDGANDFRCLEKIYLPLSKPALATLTMFCLIGHWNNWFDGLLYMRDNRMYPLQTYLQVHLSSLNEIKSQQDVLKMLSVSDRSLMYAYIVLACIPVLLVYPLLSRHLKSGLVIGSVKG